MKLALRLVPILACALSGSAGAASFAVIPQAGLAGYGATVEWGFDRYLSVSAGYTGARVNIRDLETSSARYDGDLQLRNPQIMLNWAPWGGIFRVSAGAIEQNSAYDLTATQFKDPTAASTVSAVNVRGNYPLNVAPAITVGWQSGLDRPGLGYSFTAGAMYAGTPDVTVNATCQGGVPQASCDAYTASERQKVRDELRGYRFLPILQAGLLYRL